MPLGPNDARRSVSGFALRPLAAALCLTLALPAHASWFSHKTEQLAAAQPAPAVPATETPAPAAAPVAPTAAVGAASLPDLPGNALGDTDSTDATASDNASAADDDSADAVASDDTDTDEDEVVLPSVEESALDEADAGTGHYSAEELAAQGNLWDRLRKGAQLDSSVNNERIDVQRNWYLKNSDYLDRMARRSTRYLYYTVSEAERRNLPTELALLPVIESAYDPFAYSHANAAGMWQFIPGTARIMGVKQNEWFDGRRDIIESTRAAYDFLTLLYQKFGDWQLVLAAYNAGPGAVQRAIERNQAAGLPTDFWSLRLPAETRSYVPRFLAVAQIVKSPETYGVDLRPVLNQPYFRTIDLPHQVDMPKAASIAGVSLKDFYLLNAGFKRQATDPEGPHRLLVPAALPQDFESDIAALPVPETVVSQTYRVKKGDTLFRVAKRFGLSPASLREMNHLKSDRLPVGHSLTITRGNASAEYLALREEMKLDRSPFAPRTVLRGKIYKVRRGDTLASVARRHHTSAKVLAKLNHLPLRAKLHAGQVLTLKQVKMSARLAAAGKKGSRKITYKVRRGDTLSSIGRRYNVSVTQIKTWNGKRHDINPGQGIVLYVASRGNKRGR
ncbi:MAG TPA: LysM peptidoglycan-binding domain-containing protein [Moraxellaceae bacterium]|nr:LysM peptidoglycan-binding domain-containing protein [Moraxellaceae bacterium]